MLHKKGVDNPKEKIRIEDVLEIFRTEYWWRFNIITRGALYNIYTSLTKRASESKKLSETQVRLAIRKQQTTRPANVNDELETVMKNILQATTQCQPMQFILHFELASLKVLFPNENDLVLIHKKQSALTALVIPLGSI